MIRHDPWMPWRPPAVVPRARSDRERLGSDWVSAHAANWQALLAPLAGAAGVQFLEIGSHRGRSALWWLRNILTHETARLTCVDPWWYPAGRVAAAAPEVKADFDYNIDRAGLRHKVRVLQAHSRRVVGELPDEYFDAAYIDGEHTAYDALLDGLLVLPTLKRGGILIFDDYEWRPFGAQTVPPVQPGVDAFLGICADQVEEIHRGAQLAVRKR